MFQLWNKVFVFFGIFTILCSFLQLNWVQAHDNSEQIKIQINDALVHFPDAKPLLDSNDRIHVPLRFISEELGYTVRWKKEDGTITVSLDNGPQSIQLNTYHDTALLNGDKVQLDSIPFLSEDRVYIPLRFIEESKGISVVWNNDHQIAILNEDGKKHAPALDEAFRINDEVVQEAADFKATAYSAAPEENGPWGAVDFFGNPLQLGTVAVDPAVIPLGTKLYITGYNFKGLPPEGLEAIATDTGSAIKGKRIDIFIPGPAAKVRKFGFQDVILHILKN